MFVGYPKETKGYYIYCPSENKVIIARKAIFLEKEFVLKKDSWSKVELEETPVPQTPLEEESLEVDEAPQETVGVSTTTQEPRRSGRVHRQPIRYGFLICDEQTVRVGG